MNTLPKTQALIGDTVQVESWFAARCATICNHNHPLDPEFWLSQQEVLTGWARLKPASCLPLVRECIDASQWLANMRDMDLLAKQHVHSQQWAMCVQCDASCHKPHHFEVDDRFPVHSERNVDDKKLVRNWLGPVVVCKQSGRVTFVVSVSDTKSEEHRVLDLKVYYWALQGDSLPLY